MKIALCIPVFNCLAYTREFVKSIVLSYPFDLIFHDNGSSDGTKEWLSDRANFEGIPNLGMVHVVRSAENLGVAKGANSAMKKAYSIPGITHIIYANNDILFRQETIDNLIWAWDNRPDPDLLLISGEGFHRDTFGGVEPAFEAFKAHRIGVPKFRFGACYCLFIWDKATIDRVGWLDEDYELGYFDDNDHAETILEKGGLLAHFNAAPFFHYGSVTIKINNIDNSKTFESNRERFFKKHGIFDRKVDPVDRFPAAVARVEKINEKWAVNPPEVVEHD